MKLPKTFAKEGLEEKTKQLVKEANVKDKKKDFHQIIIKYEEMFIELDTDAYIEDNKMKITMIPKVKSEEIKRAGVETDSLQGKYAIISTFLGKTTDHNTIRQNRTFDIIQNDKGELLGIGEIPIKIEYEVAEGDEDPAVEINMYSSALRLCYMVVKLEEK
ncbi:MAG: hypothetical protein KKA79_10760 [Nanoarchaeota archaeon]|nr:hypothetical protein [Nanoarchaeota archaeon]MCG2717424.1 hypothetical protein [Nanoarchaeota archaeon]